MTIDHAGLAVLSGGLIGLAIGATGGGGSLVAIPFLVYVLGVKAQPATVLLLAGYDNLASTHTFSRIHVGGSAKQPTADISRTGSL